MYAETLFESYDHDHDGYLTHEQTQLALKTLVRTPKDGSPKSDIAFACPAGAMDPASGEARVPKLWFGGLYRTMA